MPHLKKGSFLEAAMAKAEPTIQSGFSLEYVRHLRQIMTNENLI